MKISSASKKVLASALSAAMVVAFAPTVAFGEIENGETVKISYDLNGGKITSAPEASVPSATVKVSGGKATVNDEAYVYANLADKSTVITKDGASFKTWFYDVDGDNKYEDGKDVAYVNGTGIDVGVDSPISGDTIVLKAAYNEATVGTPTINIANTSAGKAAVTTLALTANGGGLEGGAKYIANVVFPDGTSVTASDTSTAAGTPAAVAFNFALSDEQRASITKGSYTFTISKLGGDFKIVKTMNVSEVTLSAGEGYLGFAAGTCTSYLVSDNVTYSQLDVAVPTVIDAYDSSYAFMGYANAQGTVVTDKDGDGLSSLTGNANKITEDTTLTATFNNPRVTTASIDTVNKVLKFSLKGLPAAASTVGGKIAYYNATITGPNGFSKTIKKTKGTDQTLTFGAEWEAAAAVTNQLEAGDYTVSVEPVLKEGKILENDEKFAIAPKTVTLAPISVDLNGGSWDDDKATKDQLKKLVTVWQVGTYFDKTAFTSVINAANDVKTADSLTTFKEWQIAGKAISGLAADAKELKVAKDGITITAVYNTAAAAPTVSAVANGAAKYDLTITAEAGRIAKYKLNGGSWVAVPDNGKITVANTAKVEVKSTTASGKDSAVDTYYGVANANSGVETMLTELGTVMNRATSASTTNKPARYGDTLTTLKSDADAATKAVGFATTKGWGKTVVAQYTAALNAVAGVEKANADALATLVASADGKTYTYVIPASIEQGKAYIDDVVAAYVANSDADKANDVKTIKKFDFTETAVDGWAIDKYFTEVRYGTSRASLDKLTVPAADVDAANAVTAQLKSTDVAVVKAGLEAYKALTDAQKQLVSAADVAAAEAVVAAAAVKDAQDDAAVSKTRNASKTVKAGKAGKTTKKQSITLKKITSKSGAKVTYKKTSGKKAITVKSGKAYLAKGVKKGTYTATVKATCGTQTAKIKVTFKVK